MSCNKLPFFVFVCGLKKQDTTCDNNNNSGLHRCWMLVAVLFKFGTEPGELFPLVSGLYVKLSLSPHGCIVAPYLMHILDLYQSFYLTLGKRKQISVYHKMIYSYAWLLTLHFWMTLCALTKRLDCVTVHLKFAIWTVSQFSTVTSSFPGLFLWIHSTYKFFLGNYRKLWDL